MNSLSPFTSSSDIPNDTAKNNDRGAKHLSYMFNSNVTLTDQYESERCSSATTSGYNTNCSIYPESLDFLQRPFSSQLNLISSAFDETWSESEQLTFIAKFIKKLNPSQSYFINTVLSSSNPLHVNLRHEQAHNIIYLNKLAHVPSAYTQLEQLSNLLPLLNTRNKQIIEKHLQILQQACLFVIDPMNQSYTDKSFLRILNNVLSLAFLHPAFCEPEYFKILENLAKNLKNYTSSSTYVKPNTLPRHNGSQLPKSSNSLPLNSSLSSKQPRNSELYFWLKTHRLHKYAGHLVHLSLSQIENLDETQISGLKITQGAQTKMLSVVQKLKNRKKCLENIKITENNLENAVSELKECLEMPSDPGIDVKLYLGLVSRIFSLLNTVNDKHVEFKFIEIIELCEIYPQKINFQLKREWVQYKKSKKEQSQNRSFFKHPGRIFNKNSNSFPRENYRKPIGSELQQKSKDLQNSYHNSICSSTSLFDDAPFGKDDMFSSNSSINGSSSLFDEHFTNHARRVDRFGSEPTSFNFD